MFFFLNFFKLFFKPGKILRFLAIILVVAVLGFGAVRFLSPGPIYATATTLTILAGEDVQVLKKGTTEWIPGKDNMILEEGDRVKTGADSYALITFFEGSTIALDPNCEVEVTELSTEEETGATTVKLKQQAGRSWARVGKLIDPASRYEVETPTGVAVVRGTLVEIDVEIDETTTTSVYKGEATVIAQQVEVVITAGRQTTVEPGKPPAPPAPIPPPVSQLIISIPDPEHSLAWLHVVDPKGRSAGMVPPGIGVNQILRTITSGDIGKPQSIEIIEPEGGEYTIALYAKKEGIVRVEVEGFTRGNSVFTQSKEVEVSLGQRYRAFLQLQVTADREIVAGTLEDFELLPRKEPFPGKVVVQQVEVDRKAQPSADFVADITEAAIGEVIQFTDLSTGEPVEWLWKFGDGTSSSEQNPSHSYTAAGTYTVSLTVTSPAGTHTTSRVNYISVYRFLEAGFAAITTQGAAPLKVQFTDLSTGSPLSWEWDFNHDGVVDSTEPNPVYTYETAGTYTVSLTVTYQVDEVERKYTSIKWDYITVE
jgi:PKD repeat protein